jgi:hypothetical protein
LHEIEIDGQRVGRVEVGYLQKEDIKLMKGLSRGRLKRKLKVGQPFGVRLIINAKEGVPTSTLGRDGVLALVEALKERFKGLEERDVFILELLPNGKKRILGRGHSLKL